MNFSDLFISLDVSICNGHMKSLKSSRRFGIPQLDGSNSSASILGKTGLRKRVLVFFISLKHRDTFHSHALITFYTVEIHGPSDSWNTRVILLADVSRLLLCLNATAVVYRFCESRRFCLLGMYLKHRLSIDFPWRVSLQAAPEMLPNDPFFPVTVRLCSRSGTIRHHPESP